MPTDKNIPCPLCTRRFKTHAAQKQHMGDAPRHDVQPVRSSSPGSGAGSSTLVTGSESASQGAASVAARAKPAAVTPGKTDITTLKKHGCADCTRAFATVQALADHARTVGHKSSVSKDGTITAKAASKTAQPAQPAQTAQTPAKDVVKTTPAPAVAAKDANKTCTPCARKFAAAIDLSNHLRDSPKHKPAAAPATKKENELSKGPGVPAPAVPSPSASEVDTKPHKCKTCAQGFATKGAAADHMRDKHKAAASTASRPVGVALAATAAVAEPAAAEPAAQSDAEEMARLAAEYVLVPAVGTKPPGPTPSAGTKAAGAMPKSQKEPREEAKTETTADKTSRCQQCQRTFGSSEARAQHVRDSPKHAVDVGGAVPTPTPVRMATPLDCFFLWHAPFQYEPDLSPEESFCALERFYDWKYNDPDRKEAWQLYQQAMAKELEVWFGSEHNIAAWHTLCRAVGVAYPPPSCKECEIVLRNTHVNIVDLISWGRSSRSEPVQVFPTKDALVAYTTSTLKIFAAEKARNDKDGHNVVLRHLLRKMVFDKPVLVQRPVLGKENGYRKAGMFDILGSIGKMGYSWS